jgi:uncharacterized membrane protein required for colicin V production
MINSALIDAVLMIYLIYSVFIGFTRGFFHVLVSIFGIYGACFIAWLFQGRFAEVLLELGIFGEQINETIGFLLLWGIAYIVIYILGKIITGAFKLTGINFLLRVSGACLNLIKAGLIVAIVLTFVSTVSSTLYQSTQFTSFFTVVGSKIMNVYKNSIDEDQIQIQEVVPSEVSDVVEELIGDDFQYNLLER